MRTKKILNPLSKKAQQLITKYRGAEYYRLSQCYEKPSWDKIDIYEECQAIASKMNAKWCRIISYNKFNFSYAFMYMDNGFVRVCVLTKDYEYHISTGYISVADFVRGWGL